MLFRNEVVYTSEASFALDTEVQKLLDSIRKQSKVEESPKVYPFNPNFITDYKGYTLGMSNEEIDYTYSDLKTGGYIPQKNFNSLPSFQIPYYKY
jgi:hypothetical protein